MPASRAASTTSSAYSPQAINRSAPHHVTTSSPIGDATVALDSPNSFMSPQTTTRSPGASTSRSRSKAARMAEGLALYESSISFRSRCVGHLASHVGRLKLGQRRGNFRQRHAKFQSDGNRRQCRSEMMPAPHRHVESLDLDPKSQATPGEMHIDRRQVAITSPSDPHNSCRRFDWPCGAATDRPHSAPPRHRPAMRQSVPLSPGLNSSCEPKPPKWASPIRVIDANFRPAQRGQLLDFARGAAPSSNAA